MRKDIKEAKILNNSLKKAKTFDRKDWRKNKKAGSDKKLAGLISLLGGKVYDIDKNVAGKKIDEIKTQIDSQKEGLQDVVSDKMTSLKENC